MKILFPASNWATNIGNPFFTLGVRYILEQALPGCEVIETASGPVRPFKLKGKAAARALDYPVHHGDLDAICFAGPMFDEDFGALFGPALRRARADGLKILLLSTGGISYTDAEIAHCGRVLDEVRPDVLTTRDTETFAAYGDHAQASRDGICGAWFAPLYYPGYATPSLGRYVASAFDFRTEPPVPDYEAALNGAPQLPVRRVGSPLRARMAKVLRPAQFAEVAGHGVVRPCHRPLRSPSVIFSQPGAFAAYTPQGYLNIYRNAAVTMTDRLHAAVVTLAYGNPAYLFLKSKRSRLLDGVGVDYQHGRRLELDQDLVTRRRQALLDFLTQAAGAPQPQRNPQTVA